MRGRDRLENGQPQSPVIVLGFQVASIYNRGVWETSYLIPWCLLGKALDHGFGQ